MRITVNLTEKQLEEIRAKYYPHLDSDVPINSKDVKIIVNDILDRFIDDNFLNPMILENQGKEKCTFCRTLYDPKTVKRVYGKESPVFLGGYCSAACYTKDILHTKK